MRMREVIVCTKCKGEDCTVEELLEKEKITMEEYGQRHAFPQDVYSSAMKLRRTGRRFLITCQDCGCQHEFIERVEPMPQYRFNVEKMNLAEIGEVDEQ